MWGGTNALGILLEDCRPDLDQYFGCGINLPDSIEVDSEYSYRLEDIYSVFESMRAEFRLPQPKAINPELEASQNLAD